MKGTGRTIFTGNRVEEFQVEILGVLENVGPKQSIIMARLSGGPLNETGVLQGMSGSPVYVDGKLIGAVALSFAFSKEPVAGIRPIEEMLHAHGVRSGTDGTRAVLPKPGTTELASLLPKPLDVASGGARLVEISTPLWLGGFTRSTLEQFSPGLRAAGLEPVQGISGGGNAMAASTPARPEPGSMISVHLMTGDLVAGADGTVTYVDGNRVYAFGHRFLATGDTELPFSRAEVITLLASQQVSFKISTPKEWMGAILQDRSTAISGEIGRRARMAPVTLRLHNRAAGTETAYHMEMASDRLLSPVLLQMAVYSALDATERTAGSSSVAIRGLLEWTDGPPVKIDNFASGDWGVPQQTSAAAAIPLSYALQSSFDALRLKSVSLDLDIWDNKRSWQIDSITAAPREVRPGEKVRVSIGFAGPNGAEQISTLDYQFPVGAPLGPVTFTASDALRANLSEYQQFLVNPPHSVAQMVEYLNGLRPNRKAYLRISRNYPSYVVEGELLSSPPPSLAMLLAKSGAAPGISQVAEMEVNAPSGAISGGKSVQVEVKE